MPTISTVDEIITRSGGSRKRGRMLRSDSAKQVSPMKLKSPRRSIADNSPNLPTPIKLMEDDLVTKRWWMKKLEDSFVDVVKPIWDPTDMKQLSVVKEALHVSTKQSSVVCREDEQKKILEFCKQCVEKGKAGSLYVCGLPGTGKSLSVEKFKGSLIDWANEDFFTKPKSRSFFGKYIVQKLKRNLDRPARDSIMAFPLILDFETKLGEGIEKLDILAINCSSLTTTSDIFSKILSSDKPPKKTRVSTSPLKQLQISYSQKQQSLGIRMTLIIADELDYLITKDRAVLYDLFLLTTLPFSRCILLGIANAIDLADRFLPKLQSLNCKPTVITFRAYSKDQIVKIIQQRLGVLPYTVFQAQALEFCAMKVASASGDMRKALEICRSSIEVLESELRENACDLNLSPLEKGFSYQQATPCEGPRNQENKIVRFDHMAVALSKAYRSPVVDTIQSLPQHQQIILCSAVKLFRRGKKDTTIGELNKSYMDICKSTLIPPMGVMELSSMCRVLDDQGILKLGQSRDEKLRRVALKVDEADIIFALQGVRFFRNCLQ